MNQQRLDQREPIHEKDINKVDQPYWYVFRPLNPVPAGAIDFVQQNISYRDFVWCDLGWTTDNTFAPAIGYPNVGVPFRVMITDINAQKQFSNERMDLTTITGTNPGANDQPMFRLIRFWRVRMNSTIRVEFENIGLVAATPTLTLGGYYTNPIEAS